MNYTKEIIKKSIEGGLDMKIPKDFDWEWFIDFRLEWLLAKPEFWQALGKALWGVEDKDHLRRYMGVDEQLMYRWQYEWHKFIDHLAENKDPDDFFKQLLTK